MTPHNWAQVSHVYHGALALAPQDRAAYLADVCAGDEELRRNIESLLANADAATGLLVAIAGASTTESPIDMPAAVQSASRGRFTGNTRFEVRRCLGEGGFGTVYEAIDRQRGATVALKVLHAASAAALYRFKREFRTLADLVHPNLVALDELHNEGDQWFFTMELVRGTPIVPFVRQPPPLALSALSDTGVVERATVAGDARGASIAGAGGSADDTRLRDTFAQLVEALAAIHRQGLVHRDIKPSNVLVTSDGRVVVLDFGLATPFRAGDTSVTTIAGTPAYMPPEQSLGHALTPAADWYSLGAMLYEALTGRLPFAGNPLELILSKQRGPIVPDDIAAPPDLLALALALLDPDPTNRPGGSAILQRLRNGPIPVPTPAPDEPGTAATLVGRDTHLRALASAFDVVRTGQSAVVFMPGRSGVGKSALVRHFLGSLRDHASAPVVFYARCHERESVPYKAVDGLVDGLTRYFQRLPAIDVARQLPRDAPLIARLFPVLLRVDEVERAHRHSSAPVDPLELRHRAAGALRELLARISDRAPLVLAIDDLQWGDHDSGILLQEVVRLPNPPAVLLLLVYRAEDAEAPLVRTLRDSLLADAGRREVRTVPVEELAPADAFALAQRELAARADITAERCAEIARESRGNSFFLHELVRHALSGGGPATLDTVIRERIGTLPTDAQHLLTAIALSAQPATAATAAAACGFAADPYESLRLLRAARLVRIRDGAVTQEIEPYHDRIREAVAGAVDTPQWGDWHRRLAAAWEAGGRARPETLVTHWHAAGDLVRAARYAAAAAETAEAALAFQRAAHYYQLLVEIDAAARPHWLARLGDALALAGRGRDAAAAYLDALRDASPDLIVDLERRAAEQLIRAGYLDQAATVLVSLLPRIGVRPPRTDAGAFIGLVARRLVLAVRGTRFAERDAATIPLDDLRRIDVLWSIGAPLSLVDLARGNNLHLRGMHLVLRAGEPRRAVRAISALACASAIAGSRRDARTRRVLDQAKALARRVDDPTCIAQTMLAEAMCHKVVGRWLLAREHLERAIAALLRCRGVRWEVETARTMLHDTLFWMGDWKRLFAEIPSRRHEADDCGDLYSATHVAVRLAAIAHLAADRPDQARAEAITGMARWPSRHFDLQHRWEVCSLIEADLYTGRAADAWDKLRLAWPRFRWTLRAFQNARIEMRFFRARIALARAARGERAFLETAADDAARLDREDADWGAALALLVRASVTATRGRRDAAVSQLAAAEHALNEAGMAHYAAAAQFRRGQLLGGVEGRAAVTRAETFFTEQTIVNPTRIANLLTPGRWTI